MYVCLCKGVTDRDIQRALDGGAMSFGDVQAQLEVSTQCGSCEAIARSIVSEHLASRAHADTFYDAMVSGANSLALA